MSDRKYQEYGFKPDPDVRLDTGGFHSNIYETIRNYAPEEKEARVLAKVLHKPGRSRLISAGYSSREEFIKNEIDPLIEKLKRLDEYFSEFIPPYYLEVAKEEKFDNFGDLEVPAILYAYKVEETPTRTEVEQRLFEAGMINFFNNCILFLKEQLKNHSYPLLLPDVRVSNFKFGTHMGDDKKKFYFVDQYPVFLPAEHVLKQQLLKPLMQRFPFAKDKIQELLSLYKEAVSI